MEIKNNGNYLKKRLDLLGGHLTGICEQNTFFIGDSPYPLPQINYVTATLTNVSPLVYDGSLKILYHLSGYGSTYQEAKLSFLGESSERYSFSMMPATLNNEIVTASYNEMTERYGNDSVLPLKFINVFPEDYPVDKLDVSDRISWVKMNSLVNPSKYIFEPAQLVMFKNPKGTEKRINVSAVSTGTASHETIARSIENSLIECLQIDSYNLWWYGGHAGVRIDVDVERLFKKHFRNYPASFLESFDIVFTDISFDKHIYIVVCEIFGKGTNRPRYTVGLQGAYSIEKALYRGLMETLTEMAYSINMSWLKPDLLMNASKMLGEMDDLDKNVAYYALHDKPDMKLNPALIDSEVRMATNLKEMITMNKDLLEWAGISNITPHEFDDLNLQVTRIVAPNILPVCMPSFPPKNHPRYLNTGGVMNDVEHPMA